MPDHQEEELFRAMLETARETENTYIPKLRNPETGMSEKLTSEQLVSLTEGKTIEIPKDLYQEFLDAHPNIQSAYIRKGNDNKPFNLLEGEKDSKPFGYVLPTQPDHIDYIYGTDPISDTPSGVGAVILKQERKARLKKNDTLVGPNGLKFKITKVSKWDFIHRLLSIGKKYYNSRIYLTTEE